MQKIMFSDKFNLTKAVLEGRKTMTRRIVPGYEGKTIPYGGIDGTKHFVIANNDRFFTSVYAIGEVVAVAQNYDYILEHEDWLGNHNYDRVRFDTRLSDVGFYNKMFVRADLMPHQIRITNVRVERLQDISDEDCLREGIREKSSFPKKKSLPFYFDGGKHSWDNSFSTPRQAFAALIDNVSGNGTWESNPWVFVYEFELVK